MSTQNINISNINIAATNVAGKCDLKCSYNFKYSESNSTAKNNSVMINLTYDSTGVPPVIFNDQKYNVGNISIVSPSIHLFDGNSLPGELIVEHNPVQGGNNLKVCVPFISSSESSNASQIITNIIQTVASNAPSEGETTNLNMSFNLQDIIPRKPFYMYQDNNNTDWIVFDALNAIPLSATTLTTLKQIIIPFPIPTPGSSLFYNSKGASSGVQIGDGIYISCKPTGSSEDETAVEYNKSNTASLDMSNILQNPTFKIIMIILIGCILFIIVFYGISSFYNYISSDAIKLPTLPKLNK